MSWLERNNIKPIPCMIYTTCSYCSQKFTCMYYLEFHNIVECFCSKECLEKYCGQMRDLVI